MYSMCHFLEDGECFPYLAKVFKICLQHTRIAYLSVPKEACWFRCKVPLQGAAVRVVCALCGGHAGAAAIRDGAGCRSHFVVMPCRCPGPTKTLRRELHLALVAPDPGRSGPGQFFL